MQTYTTEQKAQAISRVLSGEKVAHVAKEMKVSRTALQNWIAQRKNPGVMAVMTQERPTLITLIGEYLECNLRALRAQAAHMGEASWIEKQTTADLISAHDHLGRRLVSILDRLHPPERADEPDSD